MSSSARTILTKTPPAAEEVLSRVNALVPLLRLRARETEQLRRMHPDSMRDLAEAGVFKLTMPTDAGGYEANEFIVTEVLAQVARGCPSTSWICAIMLSMHMVPALMSDEAGDEIYATPDLRITGTIAPTGRAAPVEGGYRVTGKWMWNTGGIHSNWIALSCITDSDNPTPAPVWLLIPASEVEHQDNWNAAGMAGTATNIITAESVFVPTSRRIFITNLTNGVFPRRHYSDNPYFNRPWAMYAIVLSAGTMLGIARGAMDVFMATLPARGAITYTSWDKASEAPLIHHQLARAQLALESAEMFTEQLRRMLQNTYGREVSISERVQTRGRLGEVARQSRACVNQLFEASSASQVLLDADMQRYFRDVNVLFQHALMQPNSSDELYGRLLAGLGPNSNLL
jgi:3-hydroxy-9,10-secoandrosta-1,3,5(10)-triene-9,17-dione monooxygenase